MKKIVIMVALITILSGCNLWENKKAQNEENPTQPVSQSEQNSKEKSAEDTSLQTYQSDELGISFQYPASLGKAWENNYKETELFALKFLDNKDNSAGLELSGADYETLRTCNDILSKGFADGDKMPSDCETTTVDNHSVIILTYVQGGRSNSYTNASKEAQFQTKKGVWAFLATDKDLYDDLMGIVKTLKYLQ